MFPKTLIIRKETYEIIDEHLTEKQLKEFMRANPYGVYALVNEGLNNDDQMLTTFLVLHTVDFEDNVILYDVSRQVHTTVTTELFFLVKGYIEFIDVGMVDRYPIKLYRRKDIYENI
jgi:predicted hydrolase (HD superfamily)